MPAPGETFGPYRIVRRLGAGGMGVVFEAVETGRDRRVALKVLAPQYAGDATLRARFDTEARAQAALESPHVVPVHAHGEVDGTPYLAGRLVAGGDLGELLRTRGAPSPGRAVDLIAQVATGLAAAHAHGVVHRDLKPANVLLEAHDEQLTAYLTDFGIARVAGLDQGATTRGFAIGTPSYQAPELHTGAAATVASDVYSLGCLLWAALTGGPPYAGRTDYQLARAHQRATIPRLAGVSHYERELNRILRTAMAKAPTRRHRSAAALRDELRALQRYDAPARVQSAVVPPRRRPHRKPGYAGAVAVLVAILVTGVLMPGSKEHEVPSSAGERRAVAELTAALVADGGVSAGQAACTARAFVDASGMTPLVRAGLLDDDLRYVEGSRTRDEALLGALTTAALGCTAAATADTPERESVDLRGRRPDPYLGTSRRLDD